MQELTPVVVWQGKKIAGRINNCRSQKNLIIRINYTILLSINRYRWPQSYYLSCINPIVLILLCLCPSTPHEGDCLFSLNLLVDGATRASINDIKQLIKAPCLETDFSCQPYFGGVASS